MTVRVAVLATLVAALASLGSTATAAPAATSPNVVQTAVAAGQFTTLVALAKQAGLAGALSTKTVTVFAPTDAAFAKVVNDATASLYKSGAINALYEKWFLKPIPPKGITLNVPMSPQLKRVLADPTASGDPAVYK